jgi:hypothetical protein
MLPNKQKDIELRFEMLKLRFGHLLTDDELDKVKESVREVVTTAQELRKVDLDYNEGPGHLFQPYMPTDRL